MIGIIARKEMLEMMRDGRFRWAAAILLGLLCGAVALGWQHSRQVNAQHQAAQKATREQWVNQGQKNPHSAAHYGVYAFKPKMPLALLDPGIDPWVGVAAWLEAHKQNEFKYKPAQDATAVQRFGELTGAAVLQLLAPLLIVLLTFPAFAGEREQGTLRQLLSLGVPRRVLAAGKALGIASAMALILIPSAVLGILALALASDNGSLAASFPRMAWMTVGYLLYLGAFLAVSLAVSAWASSSRTALVTLLAFWIFNGLVAPRAAADVAKALYPTPSAFEFTQRVETAIKNGIHGDDPAERRLARLQQGLLKKYNVPSLDNLPVDLRGITLQANEEHSNEIFDHYYSGLWRTFHQQERVHQAAAIVAPLLAVRSISMGLAGTDYAQHTHFAQAAEEYRRMIQRRMNGDLEKNAVRVKGDYLRGQDLWEQLPEFHYEAPSLSWVIGHQWVSFALLALWTGGMALVVWVYTSRMKVD